MNEASWLFHDALAGLADLLGVKREEVLRRWEERARTQIPIAGRLDSPTLRAHMPAILVWLAHALRREAASLENAADPEAVAKLGATPWRYAQSRLGQDYEEEDLHQELNLLRLVIVDLWRGALTPTGHALERLEELFRLVTGQSAAAFANVSWDRALRRW